jgi:hypothetical protein
LNTIYLKYSHFIRANKELKGGQRAAFFTGGNSSCRAHIRLHYTTYQERCNEKDIPINHHAIPRNIWKEMQEEKAGKKQGKLEFPKVTGPTEFTRDQVLHTVAQFIACDDQVTNES